MSSIFIQIPAYHDLELEKTLESIFVNCSGENTINIGVHFNYYKFLPQQIEKCLQNKHKYGQIKSLISEAPTNLGMQRARYLANSFYNGEDFYFQTDSHMMFKKNWDSILIDDYNYLNSQYNGTIAISSYCNGYSVDREKYYNWWLKKMRYSYEEINLNEINSIGNIIGYKFSAKKNNYQNLNTLDNIHNLVSGHFIFSTGNIAKLYKESPNLSAGEEALMSMRLVSSGFNIVTQLRETAKHLFPHPYITSEEGKKSLKNEQYETMILEYPRRISRVDFLELDINSFDFHEVKNELLGLNQANNILFNNMTLVDYTKICSLEMEKI
jgi:hypothetical protein